MFQEKWKPDTPAKVPYWDLTAKISAGVLSALYVAVILVLLSWYLRHRREIGSSSQVSYTYSFQTRSTETATSSDIGTSHPYSYCS